MRAECQISSSVVNDIADKHGVSAAQVLLAWVIRPTSVSQDGARGVIAIPKASSLAHVEANAAALEIELDSDDLTQLDNAFPAPKEPVSLDIV